MIHLTHRLITYDSLLQVLGPDVKEFDYVAWTADQDAYAYSGQKCSAQSILFAHDNWVQAGLEARLKVSQCLYNVWT